MANNFNFDSISDEVLLRRLSEISKKSRRVEVALVAHIGEVDRRRLYARTEASPSMFVYCTERLHLSESETYLRLAVARAARKHPAILPMLQAGRLHLTFREDLRSAVVSRFIARPLRHTGPHHL